MRTKKLNEIGDLLPMFTAGTIRIYAEKGIIPATKVRGRFYVDPDEIKQWVSKNIKQNSYYDEH
jgi:hypothetical protein